MVLSETGIAECIERIGREILTTCQDKPRLAFVGIHNRGVPLAERVRARLAGQREDIEFGTLDISLYRDDFDNLGAIPKLRASDIAFDPAGCHVVLFDDVLFTGRTVRAAIDALMDFGRPACIELAVLADRGNRELPIFASYVGLALDTSMQDHVSVRLRETDSEDGVYLLQDRPSQT